MTDVVVVLKVCWALRFEERQNVNAAMAQSKVRVLFIDVTAAQINRMKTPIQNCLLNISHSRKECFNSSLGQERPIMNEKLYDDKRQLALTNRTILCRKKTN